MKANTLRLDHELLKEIYPFLEPKQSLVGFVKQVLKQEINRRKLSSAAERYNKFLVDHSGEALIIEEWEKAPLTTIPKKKRINPK